MNLETSRRLVEQFEAGTLPKEAWTHAAHFLVALWYCTSLTLPGAVEKIRAGIRAYNVRVGGQNTDAAGYHETITLFYMGVVAHYVIRSGIDQLTDEQITVFLEQPFLDRAFPFRFYSRERLMGAEARRQWVAPDKCADPFGCMPTLRKTCATD